MDVLRHGEADKSWESYEAQNQSGRPVDQGCMGVHSLGNGRKIRKIRKCCISNALDGSEDDAIFDDDTTEADDEKKSESEDDTADIYDDNAGAAVTRRV